MQVVKEFEQNTSSDEKWVVILMIIQYGIYNFAFFGYPIYFMKPNMLCSNNYDIEMTQCGYKEACQSFNWKIDYEHSYNSMTTAFNLVCDRENVKRFSSSLIFSGGIIGSVISILFQIKSESRRKFLINLCLIQAILAFLCVFFFRDIYLISFIMGLAFNCCYTLWISNLYVFFREFLKPKAYEITVSLANIGYGTVGCLIPVIAFILSNDWQLMLLTTCIISMSLGLLIKEKSKKFDIKKDILIQQEIQQKDEIKNYNFQEIIQFLQNNNEIRQNFQIIFFEYTLTLTLFFVIGYEIEHYGGNLLFNLSLLSIADVVGSYFSGLISLYIDLKTGQQYLMLCLSIIQISFLFSTDVENSSNFMIGFYILLNVIAKILGECFINIVHMSIPNYLPIYVIQMFYGFSSLSQRIFLFFVPYISYFFRYYINLNPNVFYGLACGLVYISLSKKQNLKDLQINHIK